MSFEAHTATFYLLFNVNQPAFAEVAAYYLASKGAAGPHHFRAGLHYDLISKDSLLNIPAGAFTPAKQTISGKSSIVRYFARAFEKHGAAYYEALSPKVQAEIDDWIDSIRKATDADTDVISTLAQRIADAVAKGGYVTSAGKLSLADLVAWDFVKVHIKSPNSKVHVHGLDAWFKKIEGVAEIKLALEEIRKVQSQVHQLHLFREQAALQLSEILKLSVTTIYNSLEAPKDVKMGDISVPIPRLRLPGNPAQLAQETVKQFKPNQYLLRAIATGPYLNIFINRDLLRDRLVPQILNLSDEYGANASGFGKTSIVEFSSPNIAKPFHAGHLRSTIIGNFVNRVLKANGWATVALNYLGDWGKQYGLLAIGFSRYGSEEELEKDPIRHLFNVYVKINNDKAENPSIDDEARAYFRKMEEGDEEALGLWQKFRDLSIVKYKDIYERLNVTFDVYSGESQYSAQQMESVVNELRDLGLLVPSEGAHIVDLKEHGLGAALITKTDGSMLYLSRDVAAAIERQKKYKFDNMFYIVGDQQIHHFKQLFKILEQMGLPWSANCQHISFGMVKSKDGNMSTRKGTVVFLEDMLNSTKEEMRAVMMRNPEKYAQIENPEHVSDVIGMTAIMTNDMSSRRIKDYELDWAKMFLFEGDTGPYLQYAHSRLSSIERKNAELSITASSETNLSILNEKEAHALIDILAQFPDVVRDSSKNFEPCNVVSYLFTLSHAISVCFETLWVMGQEKEVAEARLALYIAARTTLGNGMRLLGFRPLERM
ncbi:uncharacterized protein BJ171DRAFT_585020 [Polychytrium aggregatum]|uniref:uncharacterized protein n=1 Tax=Polychytrium aggregatum TaxID=110093 RepID=UPI0022FF1FD9|nr:uncharacterized protein BJ171DRAFT_585020 [Polychytrium aggregatum]KAI9199732.1 hypothetical protein BJ171DRAFT_585020 [Polychytrium aggregatum]